MDSFDALSASCSPVLCSLLEPSVSFYSREGWLQGGLREPSFTYFTHGSMHTCPTRVYACPSNNIEKCERVPTSFNLQESLLSSRGIVSRWIIGWPLCTSLCSSAIQIFMRLASRASPAFKKPCASVCVHTCQGFLNIQHCFIYFKFNLLKY